MVIEFGARPLRICSAASKNESARHIPRRALKRVRLAPRLWIKVVDGERAATGRGVHIKIPIIQADHGVRRAAEGGPLFSSYSQPFA